MLLEQNSFSKIKDYTNIAPLYVAPFDVFVSETGKESHIIHLPTPSTCKANFQAELNRFEFSKSGCLTKIKEPILSGYFPIAGGRIFEFIPFPKIVVF